MFERINRIKVISFILFLSFIFIFIENVDARSIQIEDTIYVYGWEDLETINAQILNESALRYLGNKEWLLSAILYVDETATVYINGSTCLWLKLNSTNGDISYIDVRGKLYIDNVKITSWNTTNNFELLVNDYSPRSFIRARDGGILDIHNSNLSYLGYRVFTRQGVSYYNTSSFNFTNNIVSFNFHGLYASTVENGKISGNIFMQNNNTTFSYQEGQPMIFNFGLVLAKSHNNIIENNIFHDNIVSLQLSEQSSNNIVRNNTIYSNSINGLDLYQAGGNNIISNNVIYNNVRQGIQIEESHNNLVENNTVYSNYRGIIVDNSSGNMILRNNVFSNNRSGILISEGAHHNNISDNIVFGNGMFGIELNKATNNTLSNNIIYLNKQDGIASYMYCRDNIIRKNIVFNNTRYGIYIAHGSPNHTIINNDVKNSPTDYVFNNASFDNAIRDMPTGTNYIKLDTDDCSVNIEYTDNKVFNTIPNKTAYWYPNVSQLKLNTSGTVTIISYNMSIIPNSKYLIVDISSWNETGGHYRWVENPNHSVYTVFHRLKVNGESTNYELIIDKILSQTLKSNSSGWLSFYWSDYSAPKQFEIRRSTSQSQIPTILSWTNSKTNDDRLAIKINTTEPVTFNASADLANVTWHWYVDDVLQNWSYDNITLQWNTTGIKSVSVQVSNENGKGNMIPWVVEVAGEEQITAVQLSEGSVGGGVGGSGGGAVTGEPHEPLENIAARKVQYIWNMNKGEHIIRLLQNPEFSLREVGFTSLASVKETSIVVEKLWNRSTSVNVSPPSEVFEYFNLWLNLPGKYLENASVKFSVDKSWIASSNIDPASIALYQYYNDSWSKLPTSMVAENGSVAIYSAFTNGFSRFAIAGSKVEVNSGSNVEVNSINQGWNFVKAITSSRTSSAFPDPLRIKYVARYDESRGEYQIYIAGFSGEGDDFEVEQGKTYLVYYV
jgi:PGF-pre-PGF domain-containing protein